MLITRGVGLEELYDPGTYSKYFLTTPEDSILPFVLSTQEKIAQPTLPSTIINPNSIKATLIKIFLAKVIVMVICLVLKKTLDLHP
jgi:hypothetical protein